MAVVPYMSPGQLASKSFYRGDPFDPPGWRRVSQKWPTVLLSRLAPPWAVDNFLPHYCPNLHASVRSQNRASIPLGWPVAFALLLLGAGGRVGKALLPTDSCIGSEGTA